MTSISTNNRPLPNFLGLAWGVSREKAKTFMREKEGTIPNEEMNGKQNLVFEGGTYASKDVKMWVLQFIDNKFHTAKILIAPPQTQTIAEFKDITARLTREYGDPAQDGIVVNPPYTEGQELQAIAAGKGIAAALYAFGKNDQLEGSILCQIAPNGQIVINHQNESLNQEAISSQVGLDAPVEGMPTMQTQTTGGGCYIVTATIGNQHHPMLFLLRSYRDFTLNVTTIGRLVIQLYYFTAPPISRVIQKYRFLRVLVYRYMVLPISYLVFRRRSR